MWLVPAASQGNQGSDHMEVHGPGSVGASLPIRELRPSPPVEQAASSAPATPRDVVDISEMGKMMDDMSRTPGVREQRLAQIKAAIEAGTYDTPEKLEIALGRMLDQVSGEADR